MPNVLIQPIVENAIFHGVAAMPRQGKLTLTIKQKGTHIVILVEDDGLGMEPETVKKLLDGEPASGQTHSIGVSNVRKRIEHIYGNGYGIQIFSKSGEGTRVILEIPYEKL